MAVYAAEDQINNALRPNGAQDDHAVASNLRYLPYSGRSFTTAAEAKAEIKILGDIYSNAPVDSDEREAAEDAMRILMRQLEEDRDIGALDDEKPKPQLVAAGKDEGGKKGIDASKNEITGPQAKLTPDSRVDLLLGIAENSPIPFSRIEAIDAVERLVEKRGATLQQQGTLRRIQESGPGNVRESAGDIFMKLTHMLHAPEKHAPKPSGPSLKHGDSDTAV